MDKPKKFTVGRWYMEFSQLYKRYKGFQKPDISLKIENKELSFSGGIEIVELETALSCKLKAQTAGFILRMPENGDGFKAVRKTLVPGKLITVSLGYQNTLAEVFKGYIHMAEMTASYSTGEIIMDVFCLDGKGIMMKNSSFESNMGMKLSQLIEDIIKKPGYSSFIKKKKLTAVEAAVNTLWLRDGKNDYELLCEIAGFLGYEFYFSLDTLCFVKRGQTGEPAAVLCRRGGIKEISLTADLTAQTAKIGAVGMDVSGKRIVVQKQRGSGNRFGESGAEKIIKGTEQTIVVREKATQKLLSYKAELAAQKMKQAFAPARIYCTGIPELIPGCFLKVTDSLEELAGSYYMTEVTHHVDEDGYFTVVTADRE